MQILKQRRAEIALRSLGTTERRQIARAIDELSSTDMSLLQDGRKLHKLASGLSDRKLFVFKGSPKLRLILSFDKDICTIEDVVDHDRVDRLVNKQGQE